jgi:FkbM family methyltransferase
MSARAIARAVIARLPRSVLYEMFYQSARALGVRGYQVDGAAGSFFGPLYDQSVIKTYLRTGAWSDNIVGLLQRFFAADGGTLYDIGANIGLVSVPIARDPRIRVVAFEPDPHNCDLLRANIAVAGVTVEVVNAAVAAEAGTLRFARSDYNAGDHRLSADGSLSVMAVALDAYSPAPGRFAVKIDTQGAEPLIFRGGATVLAAAGLIVCEFWPWGMRRMNLCPDPVLAFAERHFERGMVLRHDQPVGQPVPIAEVIARLRAVMATAREPDAVDLVLMR